MRAMRRLARWLLNLTTVMSLLLCAAAVAMWVRSAAHHDVWSAEQRWVAGPFWQARRSEVHSAGGWLVWADIREHHRPAAPSAAAAGGLAWSELPSGGWRWRVGRGLALPAIAGRQWTLGGGVETVRVERTRVRAHYAALAGGLAVAALLPATTRVAARAARDRLHRARVRRGQCPHCRYDLTGNVSGVCPECGMAVAGSEASRA
jgi:hypothetical protein